MNKFIAYYRVSTKTQGDSRLGLDAQKQAVHNYLNSVGGKLTGEFTEVMSGTFKETISVNQKIDISTLLKKRPQLQKVIQLAQSTGAIILVRTLDRLSRFSFLIEYLLTCQVRFVVTESPNDDPLILKLRASIAEQEARNISDKTKAAHAQIKLRGTTKTGKPVGNIKNLSEVSKIGRLNSIISRQAQMRTPELEKMLKFIQMLHGITFIEVCQKVNEMGFRTNRGNEFTPDNLRKTVKRLCSR